MALPSPLASNVTRDSSMPGITSTASVVPLGPVNKPVTTLSSADATNYTQSVIAPAVTKAQQDIVSQKERLMSEAQTAATAPPKTQQQMDETSGYHNPYGYGVGGERIQNPNLQPGEKDESSEISALTNTPEAGFKFAYQPDGTRVEIPVGASASQYGMTDTNPSPQMMGKSAGGVVTAVPLDDGSQVAQMGNGSYAKLDASGNFVSAISQEEFTTAKTTSNKYIKSLETQAANEFQSKFDAAVNGSNPLQPWQVDQLNSVKAEYAQLIAKQEIANANFEGGTRVFQGLLGMSQYSPGVAMGAIKDAVDQGLSKVAKLNADLAGLVGKMTSAFRSENMKELKDAYDMHAAKAKEAQEQIDKIESAVALAAENQRNYDLKVDEFEQKKLEAEQEEAHDKLADILARDTLSLAEKKQKVDEAFRNKEINETQRHNLATEAEAKAKRLQDAAGITFDPNTPFASTLSSIARSSVPRLEKEGFMKDMAATAQRGDYKTLLNDAKNQVSNGLRAAGDTALQKVEDDIRFMSRMERELAQYEAETGTTGFFKGTQAQIMAKVGQLSTDERYRQLAADMDNYFTRFRADITGAAFSEGESKGYQALVPSGDKTMELNRAVITGTKNYLENLADGVYERKMGEGYQNLKGLVNADENATKAITSYTASHSEKLPEMKENQAVLERTLGRAATPAEFLQAFPEYQ